MGVADANNAGNIHGGTIMKLADEVAALAAIKYSRHRVVTVGMDRMVFLVPIYVGELVTFKATVNAAWHTSMEIGVRVEAENPFTGRVTAHEHRLPDDGRARRRRPPGPGAAGARDDAERAAQTA